jgi:hypothetical protein
LLQPVAIATPTSNSTTESGRLSLRELFSLASHREDIYFAFGLFCLASWLVFNLWILRDYFFPCWFPPIYTASGLSKHKLQLKKQEILMRTRVSNAFAITTTIAVPNTIGDRGSICLPPLTANNKNT